MRPILASFRRPALSLARDERGASLTEMAFAVPLFVLLVTGMIDLGQGLSERFTLQQAVNRSLELLQAGPMEGDADEEDVDYSQLIREAAAAANVQPGNVTLTRWLECDNARMPEYGDNCDLGQETARYLQIRIDKLFTGSFFLDGYPITASGAVRIQ